jgi:hypothetical protein
MDIGNRHEMERFRAKNISTSMVLYCGRLIYQSADFPYMKELEKTKHVKELKELGRYFAKRKVGDGSDGA